MLKDNLQLNAEAHGQHLSKITLQPVSNLRERFIPICSAEVCPHLEQCVQFFSYTVVSSFSCLLSILCVLV